MNYEHQVELPVMHFRTSAKREYSYWKQALVREFLQNSVDAGSSEIHFETREENDNTILTVTDNGKGMSLEDCRNKLLTMGGTDKGSDSIGGYGVAKQILYFAWGNWSIRSHDYEIHGTGCRYGITENLEYVRGVKSGISIENSEGFSDYDISNYLRDCETSARIFVNGERANTWMTKGRMIRDMDWGILYRRSSADGVKLAPSSYINVRVRGVKMFTSWLSSNVDGRLTIELKGNARDILTSNRDYLKNECRDQFSALVRDLVVNTKSALRDRSGRCIRKFEGCGNTTVGIDTTEVKEMNEIVDQAKENLQPEILEKILQKTTSNPEKVCLVPIERIYEELSRATDRPDVLVKTLGRGLPAKYNPNTWSYKTECTMALWHLTLKQILTDNKVGCTFGIGITLDPDTQAEFIMETGVPYFLINPEKWRHKPSLAGSGKWLMVQELKQKAIHEIGHFASGEDHTEEFISICHLLEANTWRNEASYRSFAKLVKIKFVVGQDKNSDVLPKTEHEFSNRELDSDEQYGVDSNRGNINDKGGLNATNNLWS